MKTTKEIEVIVDDLDKATEAVETINFSVNGSAYEIDLGEKNLRKFELALAPFVEASRSRVNARIAKPVKRSTTKRTKRTGPSDAQVRVWAHANGIVVNKTGRVPTPIREAYRIAFAEKAKAAKEALESKDTQAA